jgi:hypothetical protein
MRSVMLTVGGMKIREAQTWAYPRGAALGTYLIPVYTLTVEGQNSGGEAVKRTFPVFRFGVQSEDGKTARVVGLSHSQTHIIKAWIPTYKVHSATSTENGAWQVYDSFLVHDGPDNDTELFATIGCVEVMGPSGFTKFNDLLIALMDPSGSSRDEQLNAIGKSGKLRITYESAPYPPLKKP